MYQTRQRERRELLQVVVAEHLLAADVDGLAQLGQLGERLHVVEDRALGVRRAADADVGEERRLPVAVVDLLRAVAPTQAGAVAAPGRRQRAVAHQPTEQHLPLEVGQVVRQRPAAPDRRRRAPGLTPAARRADLVVRRARELGPAVAAALGHRELQELIGRPLSNQLTTLLRHDRAELGVVRQHLDRQLLVDDLADLLLGAVGQGDPRPVGRSSRTSRRSSPAAG